MSNPPWIITVEELKNERSNVLLVDVREQSEWDEIHLEGAKHIPLGELMTRAESELKEDQDIVVYCAHGMRSLQGVMILKQMGFRKLRSLDGGIAVWEETFPGEK
jgi:rhodanese-related sulfurtransferase